MQPRSRRLTALTYQRRLVIALWVFVAYLLFLYAVLRWGGGHGGGLTITD
jgi:hypothetical protein